MGEWHFSPRHSDEARLYKRTIRRAEIAVFHEMVLPNLRVAAREIGYAITEHGSMARDVDLVAIPWTDDAASSDALIAAICAAIREATGWGHNPLDPKPKPHGRIAITLVADAEIQVDLSIMPRATLSDQEGA